MFFLHIPTFNGRIADFSVSVFPPPVWNLPPTLSSPPWTQFCPLEDVLIGIQSSVYPNSTCVLRLSLSDVCCIIRSGGVASLVPIGISTPFARTYWLVHLASVCCMCACCLNKVNTLTPFCAILECLYAGVHYEAVPVYKRQSVILSKLITIRRRLSFVPWPCGCDNYCNTFFKFSSVLLSFCYIVVHSKSLFYSVLKDRRCKKI